MFRFTFNGMEFSIEDYVIYDGDNHRVTDAQAKELVSYYVKSLDFNNMEKKIVFAGIKFAYMYEDYEDVPKLIRIYFDREDVEPSEKKLILPRLTEVYRKLGEPRKAVNLFKYVREFYGDYLLSTEMVAEVAHALCDLKKYEDAKMMCEWVFTMRKPNLDCISEVFNRIQKETGEL